MHVFGILICNKFSIANEYACSLYHTRYIVLSDQSKVMLEDMFYIRLISSVPLCNKPIWGSTRLIISPSKSYN